MKSTTMNFIAMTVVLGFTAVARVGGQAQGNNENLMYYSVRSLGTLGGVLGSSAHSIGDRGWIAGVANLAGDTEEHAVLWQEDDITDLGTLGGDNSNVDFPVKNDDGVIVGFAETSTPDPLGENFCTFYCTPSGGSCNGNNLSCRGFRWRNGLMEPLGTLGGNNSAATGANNHGLLVGVAENKRQDSNCVSPQILDYEAVVWSGHTTRELPPVPGDAIGIALAVNDNRQIVGGTGMCGSGPGIGAVFMHAVLWKNYSPTDLGNLGGALNNVAYALNNRGQVVGASDLAGDNTGHAFFWQNGVMTDLGTLPGDFSSFAFSINDRGQVVGQSCDLNFNCRAFFWQNGVMTDLNSLATRSSLYLISAADINSRGNIVGTGLDESTGEPLAFVATPGDEDNAVAYRNRDTAQTATLVRIFGNQRKFVVPEEVREQLRRNREFRLSR